MLTACHKHMQALCCTSSQHMYTPDLEMATVPPAHLVLAAQETEVLNCEVLRHSGCQQKGTHPCGCRREHSAVWGHSGHQLFYLRRAQQPSEYGS